MRPAVIVMAVSLPVVAGCSGDAFPQVRDAVLGVPAGPNAALYLIVDGYAGGDRLVGAATEVADRVEIHQTVIDEDGTTVMVPVDGLPLPAEGEGSLVLSPGGAHLMLVGVDRLEPGDRVEVTLVFERAGEVVSTAVVVPPDETLGHGG